ncbi:MAG TPA: cytochrome c-type biogenesis protein [Chloroflexota bacterium]|nr:cytochrome c-type biogenesis protein [Chloroflexota bacterium]
MKPEAAQRLPAAGGRRLAVLVALIGLLVVGAMTHLLLGGPAATLTPEARAHAIGERLACPICEGLSVADSPSALAQQMRGVISDQVAAGKSDAQIEQYFVDRYGPAILLTPPKQGFTLLAWWGPVLFFLISAIGVSLAAYRWARRSSPDPELLHLSAEEERRYAARLAAELPAVDERPGAVGGLAHPVPSTTPSREAPDASPSAEQGAW